MEKQIPIGLKRKLKQLPLEEVMFWASFSRSKFFRDFEKYVFAEAERRKNVIWRLPEGDPQRLSIDKAALRGGIETMYMIVAMAKAANDELDQRSEEKK